MANDSCFYFKDFQVEQHTGVFKVGTDGVLAGLLVESGKYQRILEVGTGTGLISLLLANRFPEVSITAIDLQDEAVKLAAYNFEHSPFANRLTAIQANYLQFSTDEPFDLIVSNPPYFLPNQQTTDVKRQTARQTTHLSAELLLQHAPTLLQPTGKLALIAPNLPVIAPFNLEKVVRIRSYPHTPFIRFFGTYSMLFPKLETIFDELTLYENGQKRSPAYHSLSERFYIR